TQAVKIFICYAHEDEDQRQELVKHLRGLKQQELIDVWYDRNISPGAAWEREIETHLSEAQIILLLISSDFISSDYIQTYELERAMEKHERGEAIVVPIILRPVYWQGASFGKLQALPTDGKPIKSASWYSSDEAFFNVTEGIRNLIEEFSGRQNAKQVRIVDERQAKINRVLVALENPNYKWRTIEAVSKETSIPLKEAQEIISELGAQVIKSSKPDINGRSLYTTRAHYVAS
ncbi:MAG TPA: toll/interleukin-1 receptor domain-containing protein, partial [Ktedonobacteraceae bacterium]|nr:toll/interleukin-1 receptor domain-containing protein [Ktedonobacteraceae bacterium]